MQNDERDFFLAWSRLRAFRQKVERSNQIIADALSLGHTYAAVSWGKQSVAMLHLIQQQSPQTAAVFITGEHDDLIDNFAEVKTSYLARFATNYSEVALVNDHVPDTIRLSSLHETYPVAFVGLSAEESKGRRASLKAHGVIHQYQSGVLKGTWRVCPLAWWSWRDVWAYLVANNLPYLASYDHPGNESKARSRTCNALSKDGTAGAVNLGRIARLRHTAPAFYQYLAEHFPHIAMES